MHTAEKQLNFLKELRYHTWICSLRHQENFTHTQKKKKQGKKINLLFNCDIL